MISRCSRLYPTYWLAVSITALICWAWGPELFKPGLLQYLANMTMISGYFGVPDIDGVYWTLLIEIVFYCYIFTLLQLRLLHRMLYFCAIWLALAYLSILVAIPHRIEYFLILKWAQYFISGAVLYIMSKEGAKPFPIVLLLLSYFLALFRLFNRASGISQEYAEYVDPYVCMGIVTVFYVVMILISFRKLTIQRYSKQIMVMGALSYPMYLMHHNIGYVFLTHFEASANKYVLIGVLFFFVLVLSYGAVLYEKPMSKAVKRMLHHFFKSPALDYLSGVVAKIRRPALTVGFIALIIALCIGLAYGPDILRQRSATPYITTRQSFLLRQAEQVKTCDLLIIGDSLVEGMYFTPSCRARVFVAGIGGTRVADWMVFAPRLLNVLKPRAVFIALGINDAKRNTFSKERFASQYERLCRFFSEQGVSVHLSTVLSVESGKPFGDAYFDVNAIRDANKIIRKAAEGDGAKIVDSHTAFTATNAGLMPLGMTVDGVHLNKEGYAVWMAFIDSRLCEMMSSDSIPSSE